MTGKPKTGPTLSYRQAAQILNCSHQTVSDLLRSGKLADLMPETVATFAQTYQPKPGTGPRWGGRTRIVLPDGREVRGWETASALLDCNRANLRKRSNWHDGRFVIRPSNRKKSA